MRPFFDSEEKHPRCPYCDAAKRWHARLDTHCIEGGKTTDAARRKLVKSIEKKGDQFAVTELKSDRRQAFFDWLDTLRISIDLSEPEWLLAATRALLERKELKQNWDEVFEGFEVAGLGNVKLYFVVDRREFLDRVKSVYAAYA